MSIRLINTFIIMTLLVGCSSSGVIKQDFDEKRILHYSKMKNIDDMSGYVFYLNKGDKLPVNIKLENELLNIDKNKINVVIKKKIYFRLIMPQEITKASEKELSEQEKQILLSKVIIYVSNDAREWARYMDMKAVKKVFGIKGGSFAAGMGFSKEEGIQISLNMKINSI